MTRLLLGIVINALFVSKAGATAGARKSLIRSNKASGKASLSFGEPHANSLRFVDCGLNDESSALLLLTSTGLGSWGDNGITLDPSAELIQAFRDLILRLPDTAWSKDGAARKAAARNRTLDDLQQVAFAEPELYQGLNAVILEDDCFLKESFWNQASPFFSLSSGIGLNYLKAGLATNADLVQPYFGHGLDKGWCLDFAANRTGLLGGLGFEASRIDHVSLWDELATDKEKVDLFKLQTAGHLNISGAKAPDNKVAESMRRLLEEADVVIVNGGNPDFGKYAYTVFAADIMKTVTSRVVGGSLVFMGQSAGSMLGGADVGLTYEPNPGLLTHLLHGQTAGLGFAGKCAIRPHDQSQLWDLAAAVYGKLRNLTVVRVANGQALQCLGATCSLVGEPAASLSSVFSGPDGEQGLERLVNVFASQDREVAKSLAWRSQVGFVHAAAGVVSLLLMS